MDKREADGGGEPARSLPVGLVSLAQYIERMLSMLGLELTPTPRDNAGEDSVGLGRIVALYYRSSTLHQIR